MQDSDLFQLQNFQVPQLEDRSEWRNFMQQVESNAARYEWLQTHALLPQVRLAKEPGKED
jgi:hypothetical protein